MKRKNFGAKPLCYPQPVFIIGTYDENGNPNAMNAAWGGISDYNEITISMSPHRTTENVIKSKAFTIAFADTRNVVASDYVGIVSLNQDPKKMEKSGLHVVKSDKVNAPVFEEYPVTLELELISFEDGLLKGKIVGVLADEEVLTKDGKIDATKCHFISFDGALNRYIELGEPVGKAFVDGQKLK